MGDDKYGDLRDMKLDGPKTLFILLGVGAVFAIGLFFSNLDDSAPGGRPETRATIRWVCGVYLAACVLVLPWLGPRAFGGLTKTEEWKGERAKFLAFFGIAGLQRLFGLLALMGGQYLTVTAMTPAQRAFRIGVCTAGVIGFIVTGAILLHRRRREAAATAAGAEPRKR